MAQIQSPTNEPRREEPGSQGSSGDIQVTEITGKSKISLAVLDKNCPTIVKPYLMGNAIAIGAFIAKESAKTGLEWLKKKFLVLLIMS